MSLRTIAAVCLSTALLVAAPRVCAQTVFFVDDPAKWATPTKVLPPTFPALELAQGVTGHVDVTVLVSDAGTFKQIVSMASTPKVPAFEAAVAEVLSHWEFSESFGTDCSPVEAEGTSRIWFEIKEGKPVISVSRVDRPLPANLRRAWVTNLREVGDELRRRRPQLGGSGRVLVPFYALLTVEAATGKTVDVKVTGVRTSRAEAATFLAAIQHGMQQAKIDVTWPERDGTVQVCSSMRITFVY